MGKELDSRKNNISGILPKVENGKISFDNIAQSKGFKNESEMLRYKKENPNLYAVMGGYKYEPNMMSKNYTALTNEGKKIVQSAQEKDDYYRKYGVLSFAENYNIDAEKIQSEINNLSKKVKEAEENDKLYKNLVLSTDIRKDKLNKLNEILNEYECQDIDELRGVLSSKKKSLEFWKGSNELVKMTSVGDINSESYDPEFDKWSQIGKNLKSDNIGGEKLAPHQALNPVESARTAYADYVGNIEGFSKKLLLICLTIVKKK